MNKVKSQDKQIWFFLVHFEEAYLNHVQSTPRSQTHPKINKLLPVKRLQNHNNGEISFHIFAKQSIYLMWGGVGGGWYISEAGVSRRGGLLRSDHQTVGLLLSSLCPPWRLPTANRGLLGSPVLSSCRWHFHPCSMTLGRTDHPPWTWPKLQPIPLCVATWLSCHVPKSPGGTRLSSPTTEGGEPACQRVQRGARSWRTHRQRPANPASRLAETLLT